MITVLWLTSCFISAYLGYRITCKLHNLPLRWIIGIFSVVFVTLSIELFDLEPPGRVSIVRESKELLSIAQVSLLYIANWMCKGTFFGVLVYRENDSEKLT